MKYFITAFVTAVIVFIGATIYYKGLPSFATPKGLSVVNTEVASATPVPTPIPTSVSTTEKDDLAKIIKAALIKKHGSNAASLNVTVSKIEGDYAQGGASGQGGGGMWFAAKLNGNWTLVWDGNGIITCDDVSPYPGFPASMIPECWNTSTNKIVTR